jgi:hypothetical protein
MPDTRIERGTCRFVARRGEGGTEASRTFSFKASASFCAAVSSEHPMFAGEFLPAVKCS